MADRTPFVLLDDARASDAAGARFYTNPLRVFAAHRPQDVAHVLEEADHARRESGATLAGYIGYEAGLALEPRLAPLAAARSGASGPLVWLGLFEDCDTIEAAAMPDWLAQRSSGAASLGPLDPQLSPGGYARAFETLKEAIRAGDIYQANLTFPLAGSYRGDPLALYAKLRSEAAAGYGGIVFDGSHWLLSLSPELFVSLRGDEARAKPMKGTRPRGSDAVEDAALARDLSTSVKDRAENLMIVDLMRNDLSRVARTGSVAVQAPFAVETYPTLHQMVSTIRATLRDGCGAFDLVQALFPCGSITGAPKIRAMELIDSVEREPRGPYCGAIGRIDGSGDAAFNVAIRTLRLTPTENERGSAVLGIGSAIVADSEAMPEWRECIVKAGFVRGAASGFDLVETMRFDPEEGIALLELHLERMRTSAAELGFAFDRHAARNRIQALCFDLEEAAMVRLLLSRGGAKALETRPLPAAAEGPVICAVLPLPVDEGDFRLRHKTTDRALYEAAHEVAREAGAGEALLVREDGLLTEGSYTNLFVERDGMLLTPPARLGLLPGVLRHALIEQRSAVEAELRIADLEDGFMIGNSVRGLVAARLLS